MARSRFAQPQHTEIGTSALLLAPADSQRQTCRIQNTGQNTIYLGSSVVTALTGLPLDGGQYCTAVTSQAIYGIAAGGLLTHAAVTETLGY